MTAWAVTQTTRFKAAMMGAGVSDFHSFHAQTNIQDWDARILTATPQRAARGLSPALGHHLSQSTSPRRR